MSFRFDIGKTDKFSYNRSRAYRQLYTALVNRFAEIKSFRPDITNTMAEELGIPESKVIEKLTGGGLPFNDICDLYVAMGEEPFSNLGLFDFEAPIFMSPVDALADLGNL